MAGVEERNDFVRLLRQFLQALFKFGIGEEVGIHGDQRLSAALGAGFAHQRAAAVAGVVDEYLIVRLQAVGEIVERTAHAGERELLVAQPDDVLLRHAHLACDRRGRLAVLLHTGERRHATLILADGQDQRMDLGQCRRDNAHGQDRYRTTQKRKTKFHDAPALILVGLITIVDTAK